MELVKALEHEIVALDAILREPSGYSRLSAIDRRLLAWTPGARDVVARVGDAPALARFDALTEHEGMRAILLNGEDRAKGVREYMHSLLRSVRAAADSGPREHEVANEIRRQVAGLKDPHIRAFVDEAIGCLEHGYLRAAVVLSWAGAVAVLHARVTNGNLPAFNAEARRRNPKWKDASSEDDLARMRDRDFLDVIAAIGMLQANVKNDLQSVCLSLRNGCGHPNSMKLGRQRVIAHLEILLLNVFSA